MSFAEPDNSHKVMRDMRAQGDHCRQAEVASRPGRPSSTAATATIDRAHRGVGTRALRSPVVTAVDTRMET
jgi:hypothetical protein